MFEIPRARCSYSSDLSVHHSSPVAIPPSATQDVSPNTAVHLSVLPGGTIPDSPAPIRTAIAVDAVVLTPSPPSSPVVEMNAIAEAIPTPMPGTHLPFEDIQPDVALSLSPAKMSHRQSGYFGMVLKEGCRETCHSAYAQLECQSTREPGERPPKELQTSRLGMRFVSNNTSTHLRALRSRCREDRLSDARRGVS